MDRNAVRDVWSVVVNRVDAGRLAASSQTVKGVKGQIFTPLLKSKRQYSEF